MFYIKYHFIYYILWHLGVEHQHHRVKGVDQLFARMVPNVDGIQLFQETTHSALCVWKIFLSEAAKNYRVTTISIRNVWKSGRLKEIGRVLYVDRLLTSHSSG